jgi:hypothetical protein
VIPSGLITSSLAVLAFVIAFYALMARERKTPYITKFIYAPAITIFASVLLILISQAFQAQKLGFVATFIGIPPGTPGPGQAASARPPSLVGPPLWFEIAATIVFYLGTFWILINIWRLHCRDVYFRDEVRYKDFALVRYFRYRHIRSLPKPSYEYEPLSVDTQQIKRAMESSNFCQPVLATRISFVATCGVPIALSDPKILSLTLHLLQAGWFVQFATCFRHPFDFIEQLRMLSGDQWQTLAGRIVVVDAYTPHFGFSDSVHIVRRDQIKKWGTHFVRGARSYAGIHSATAKAFNKLKKESDGKLRKPTLTIFEGCSALVDLESPEQYRTFLRHVVPSERMWGGMLTLFVEPAISEQDSSLMRAYADVFWDGKTADSVGKSLKAEAKDVVGA